MPLQVLVAFWGGAQQSELALHERPMLAQAPQAPVERHLPVQQSAEVVQEPPVPAQVPQAPLMQDSPLQHWDELWQETPVDAQVAHWLPKQPTLPQQSVAELQKPPLGAQVLQLPDLHSRPLQQSDALPQPDPLGPQGFLQVPSLHSRPPQQSDFDPQPAPSTEQHWPDSHESGLQHSALVVQEPPADEQGAQVPALQMFEQQSLANEQLEPSGLQELHWPLKQLSPGQQEPPSAQLDPSPPQAVQI